MVMRIHTSPFKTVVVFMLMLCLTTPLLLPAVSALIISNHTHVCAYEEYKEVCYDVKQCCRICLHLYNVKNSVTALYSSVTGKIHTIPEPHMSYAGADFAFLYASFPTLVSLKIRMNN